mgnify:FL=1
MNKFFLIRFSFLNIQNLINKKVNLIINLSIFVIIFALSASLISIMFENRIETLESKVTKNEINQLLYTKWLNRSPKIIVEINNIDQNRKTLKLFTEVVKLLPDDDDDETSSLYSARDELFEYSYYINEIVINNFKNIDLSLTDAILLSSSDTDIKNIEQEKKKFRKLINQFDQNRYERIKFVDNKNTQNWKETQLYYKQFETYIQKNKQIIDEQKLFFLNFVSNYFSSKRQYYTNKNLEHLNEISDFAKLETRFIFFAFLIQFFIFTILQIFEVTIERERKNEKNKKTII